MKASFKMLRLSFPSKFDWSSYNASTVKTACLDSFYKVLFPFEITLYFYKSTKSLLGNISVTCGVPSCYLDLMNKLKKWVYGPWSNPAYAFLEPLAHCQNVANVFS